MRNESALRNAGNRHLRRPLQVALATAFAPLAAMAQTSPPPADASGGADTVVVTGQRASLRKGIVVQQAANNIVSAVSADDIGSLPDKNAAEALARIPGVSVQRDQGEGRYIAVRGLGPDYNAVTINGAIVPSPEASRRAVSLDVLPAALIRTLEVRKTLTPDMDASSLGGTVEVKTLSAFDLARGVLAVNVEASRDQNNGRTSPSGGLLWADRFLDGRLGIALGLNLEKRDFGSDDTETGGAWSNGRLTGFEIRDYNPVRERNAAGLNVDYRPRAGEAYYLRGVLSRFSDDEVRDRITVSNIAGGSVAEGETVTARVERRLRQRKYTRQIDSLVLGTEQQWGDWRLEASGGQSHGNEDTPEQLNDARFRGTANFAGVGFTDSQRPTLFGPAALTDPSRYALNAITFQQRTSRDEASHLRLDVTRSLDAGGWGVDVRAGVKAGRREKTNDTEQWAYTSSNAISPNYWGAGSTSLTAFVGGDRSSPFAAIGPGIDPALVRARVAGLNRTAARSVAESSLPDFTMNEDIDAGYLQASMSSGPWFLLAGVRHERTQFDAAGFQTSGTTLTPLSRSRSYGHWLPSAHLRWDYDRNTSVRAAVTSSVVRANFDQLSPGISLASATEATIGNPDLNPLRSRNVDVGVEMLLGRDGAASVYAFTKDIKDFTYQTNLAGTGAWVNYTTATGYANGDNARVNGLELSYQHILRMLPEPFDGILLGANATFTDSKATVSRYDKTAGAQRSRDIRMPGQSDRVFNLVVGYEKGPISARLALNHKTPYLLALGSDILNPALDQVVDRQQQIDLSIKYQIDRTFQAVFEVVNLNNEHYYVYQGSRPFNVQYEQYGRTVKVGLKASF